MNELTVWERFQNPLEAIEKMGTAMAKSRWFGVDNVEAGQVIALTCACENITPLEFYKTYHIIGNGPSMKGDAILAAFEADGGEYDIGDYENDVVEITFTTGSRSITIRLTWDEMQLEPWPWKDKNDHTKGLRDNWATPRQRRNMLWNRAISEGVRRVMPGVVAGIHTPEEMRDVESNGEAKPLKVEGVSYEDASAAKLPSDLAVELSPADYALPGYAHGDQQEQLNQLFRMAGLSDEQVTEVLAKRDCKTVSALTEEQAEDLIRKIKAQLKN